MKKILAGLFAGLVLGTTGVAGAVTLGEWRHFENDGVVCSIGKRGTNVDTSGVCVMYGGKFNQWSMSFDNELGLKVVDGNKRIVFGRGSLGRG